MPASMEQQQRQGEEAAAGNTLQARGNRSSCCCCRRQHPLTPHLVTERCAGDKLQEGDVSGRSCRCGTTRLGRAWCGIDTVCCRRLIGPATTH